MAARDEGKPLPKFGEWDVNNPAAAEGFTVIFNKARAEKKTTGSAAHAVAVPSPQKHDTRHKDGDKFKNSKRSKWLCMG